MPCSDSNTPGEKCRCDDPTNFQVGRYCDGFNNCPSHYLSSSEECSPHCLHFHNTTYHQYGCDVKITNSINVDLESIGFVNESRICSLVALTHSVTCCDGILEATFFDHSDYLGDDENNSYCDSIGRYFCDNLINPDVVSISSDFVCDTYTDCVGAVDEMGCDDGRFYCMSGVPLFIPKTKVYDGNLDCSDSSDECRFVDSFSSAFQLIDNPLLRAAVWVMAVFAVTGNLIVIIGQCRSLSTLKQPSSSLLKINHSLVLNLAFADLLMGVYLLLLACYDVIYSGDYCVHDVGWRSGLTCTAMGCLVVVSSQTSVCTMVWLTSVRLYSIIKPFSAQQLSNKVIFLLISTTWLSSSILAFFPFLPKMESRFYSTALLHSDNLYFKDNFVSFSEYKSFLERVAHHKTTHNPADTVKVVEALTSAHTWKQLTGAACDLFDDCSDMSVKHIFGYYSLNSVCLPKLFVSNSNEISHFSLVIIFFNFVSFVYVMLSHIVMHVLVTRSNKLVMRGGIRKQRNSELQNKIVRLIASDFCCWMPICILALLRRNNIDVVGWVYDGIAIIIYPINSILNPILYSNIVDNFCFNIRQRFRPLSENTFEVSI